MNSGYKLLLFFFLPKIQLSFPKTQKKKLFSQKLDLEKLDRKELKAVINKLHLQRDVIGRKVSDIILKNSQAYSQELQRISDLKLLLEDCHQLCSISRRSVLMSKLIFILPALNLVRKQVKKLYMVKLLKSIRAIKSFVIIWLLIFI
jgi:hypothetical protein